jgi:hypothetical protein
MTGISRFPQARQRLLNRRSSVSFNFEQNGLSYLCTYSKFDDGHLGEIFISNRKSGSHADACARDAAIAASLALQYGCPLDVLQHALLRDARGHAATPLGAALDEIAKQEEGRPK